MRTRIKEVQRIDWLDGALMNCIWEGPRLRDFLLRAGVKYDNAEKSSDPKEFTSSLQAIRRRPLKKTGMVEASRGTEPSPRTRM
jgi:sulfite oxidase